MHENGGDERGGNRLREAVENAFFRADEGYAGDVSDKRDHVSDKHHAGDAEPSDRAWHIVKLPRAEHEQEENASHQERPSLNHRDRVISREAPGTDVVDHNAERTEKAGQERKRSDLEMGRITVSGDQENSGKRKQRGEDLDPGGAAFCDQAGRKQDDDRGEALQDRGDGRGRKLDRRKVEKLAEGDAREPVKNQTQGGFTVLPRSECFLSVADQAEDKKDDAGKSETNWDKPAAVHPFRGK